MRQITTGFSKALLVMQTLFGETAFLPDSSVLSMTFFGELTLRKAMFSELLLCEAMFGEAAAFLSDGRGRFCTVLLGIEHAVIRRGIAAVGRGGTWWDMGKGGGGGIWKRMLWGGGAVW